MTPRDRRPRDEHGPVDWGTSRPAQGRPRGGASRPDRSPVDPPELLDDGAPPSAPDGPDWGVGRGEAHRPPASSGGPDWGVGRGRSRPVCSPRGRGGASPWPAAAGGQRWAGVAFALVGLVLATVSAMNLARNAEAGHLWVPPWLVAVLGGAGLVAAAGYLAWAGGTPVRQEAGRWRPTVLDAAAGLTTGTVEVHDPQRLLAGDRAHPGGPGLPGQAPPTGRDPAGAPEAAPSARTGGSEASVHATIHATMDSGPRPIMGTSTVDQSMHAPAGVAGAVGGFLLAGAVVCAVIALVLGPAWLIATGGLALGGIVSIYLAKDWLGAI
ncbi:PsbA protein [Actinomyces bowdenii]|nr:PsbA protein [Actinomyces bowdenii]